MTTTPAATWYPIDQAAAALGVSRRTLQRRVVRGEVQAEHREGRCWVRVELAEDRQADAAVLLATVERNSALAELVTASTRDMVAWHQGRVEQLQGDLRAARRSWRWAAGVAAAAVAAGTAGTWYLSHHAAATAGQLVATVSHLDDARSTLAAREAALAGLQAALDAAREGATKTATEAALSRHRAEDLGGQVARLELELDAAGKQLGDLLATVTAPPPAPAWPARAWSGAPLLGTSW
jgi:hypothetical protein